MIKSKKVITTLMLSLILTIGSVATVFAEQDVSSIDTTSVSTRTRLPGSDMWTRGLYKSTDPGWYMAYSYYKNGSYNTYVKASLGGDCYRRNGVCGYTVTINNEKKTTSGYAVYAGIR